jgi:hypothetical protein
MDGADDLLSFQDVLDLCGKARRRGRLHVFTTFRAVDLYLEEGRIICAISSNSLAKVDVREVLGWKDADWVWMSNASPEPALFAPPQLIPNEPPAQPPGDLPADPSLSKGATRKLPKSIAKNPIVWQLRSTSSGETYKLANTHAVIGRDDDCDIMIDHPSVSRHHCVVEVRGNLLHFTDMGSLNGIQIGGQRVEEGGVASGEELILGHLTLHCTAAPDPGAAGPAKPHSGKTSRLITNQPTFVRLGITLPPGAKATQRK